MKSLVFIVAVMLTSAAQAWEVPGNPDRYLSVGFAARQSNINGERIETDIPTSPLTRSWTGNDDFHTTEFAADVRIPLRPDFTLGVEAAHIRMDNDFQREQNSFTESVKAEGFRIGISCRIFFTE